MKQLDNKKLIALKEQLLSIEQDILSHVRGGYNYGHKPIWCVNVKNYSYVDGETVKKIIAEYPENQRPYITDMFDSERIYESYNNWLEFEADYFINDVVKNGYAYDKDSQEEKYFEVLRDNKTIADSLGLYGRSGGWFGFNAEPILETINQAYQAFEYEQDEDFAYMAEQAIEMYDAGKFVLELADKFNKGLDFEEELRYRISEYVGDDIVPLLADKMQQGVVVDTLKELHEELSGIEYEGKAGLNKDNIGRYLVDLEQAIKRLEVHN